MGSSSLLAGAGGSNWAVRGGRQLHPARQPLWRPPVLAHRDGDAGTLSALPGRVDGVKVADFSAGISQARGAACGMLALLLLLGLRCPSVPLLSRGCNTPRGVTFALNQILHPRESAELPLPSHQHGSSDSTPAPATVAAAQPPRAPAAKTEANPKDGIGVEQRRRPRDGGRRRGSRKEEREGERRGGRWEGRFGVETEFLVRASGADFQCLFYLFS